MPNNIETDNVHGKETSFRDVPQANCVSLGQCDVAESTSKDDAQVNSPDKVSSGRNSNKEQWMNLIKEHPTKFPNLFSPNHARYLQSTDIIHGNAGTMDHENKK